jgi:hypothetical protein
VDPTKGEQRGQTESTQFFLLNMQVRKLIHTQDHSEGIGRMPGTDRVPSRKKHEITRKDASIPTIPNCHNYSEYSAQINLCYLSIAMGQIPRLLNPRTGLFQI